ncbi:MAG TPA: TetR/AcrR family transcriptional regulator [Acidimicrobiales bacterium]|nr:TetR/AcrR family transcriptional regulator [Acidimicrobiales bacterium]
MGNSLAQAQPRPIGPPLLPPRATADGTHRRLLEAALVRFGERGFHGVSVREIAEAAGVRASSVYAHLESKEQLLFQLMLIGHEEHHDRLRQALLDAGSDPMDQISRLVEAHVIFHGTFPLLARVANREMAPLAPPSRERVLAVRHASEQLFLDVIERGRRLGEFRVDDSWLGMAAIGSMGIRVAEWWVEGDHQVEEVARIYAHFARRLLTADR